MTSKQLEKVLGILEGFVPTHLKSGNPNPNHPAYPTHKAKFDADKAALKANKKEISAARPDDSHKVTTRHYYTAFDGIPDRDPHDAIHNLSKHLRISHEDAERGLSRHSKQGGFKKGFHQEYMHNVKSYHDDNRANESENLDELSTGTLSKYISKATDDVRRRVRGKTDAQLQAALPKIQNRQDGIMSAVRKHRIGSEEPKTTSVSADHPELKKIRDEYETQEGKGAFDKKSHEMSDDPKVRKWGSDLHHKYNETKKKLSESVDESDVVRKVGDRTYASAASVINKARELASQEDGADKKGRVKVSVKHLVAAKKLITGVQESEDLDESKKAKDPNKPFVYADWANSGNRAPPGYGKNGKITKMLAGLKRREQEQELEKKKKLNEADKTIAGGSGKGKSFSEASEQEHKEALIHHAEGYRSAVKNDNNELASHHIRRYSDHLDHLNSKGIKESSDLVNGHIEQVLGQKDINASVKGDTVHVYDKSHVAPARRLVARLGQSHKVVHSSANEGQIVSSDMKPGKDGRLYPAHRKNVGQKETKSEDQ